MKHLKKNKKSMPAWIDSLCGNFVVFNQRTLNTTVSLGKKTLLICVLLATLLLGGVTKNCYAQDICSIEVGFNGNLMGQYGIYDFGDVQLCITKNYTFQIYNIGSTGPIFKGNISCGNHDAFTWSCANCSNNCSFSVPISDKRTVAQVSFRPTYTEGQGASFYITNHTDCYYKNQFYTSSQPILISFQGNGIGACPCNLSLSPTSKDVSSSSGNITVNVTSNVDWDVTGICGWISGSNTSGSNNGSFTLNYQQNTSTSSRSCIMTISGGGCSQNFILSQNGVACNLSLSPNSPQTVNSNSGNITVNVTSNVGWDVTGICNDWITASTTSGSNNGSFTLNYQQNTSISPRTCTMTVSGGGCSKEFVLSQNGDACNLSLSPTSPQTINSNSGNMTVNVNSNVSWDVTGICNDWITASTTSGSNNGSFTLNYQQNTSISPRTCTMTVSGGGCSKEFVLTQNPPNLLPIVKITSHTDGQVVYTSNNTFSGTAYDSDGTINKVRIRLYPWGWQDATGTNNWIKEISDLSPGINTIQVQAQDNSLVWSEPPVSITVNYKPPCVIEDIYIEDKIIPKFPNFQYLYNPSSSGFTGDYLYHNNKYYIIPTTETTFKVDVSLSVPMGATGCRFYGELMNSFTYKNTVNDKRWLYTFVGSDFSAPATVVSRPISLNEIQDYGEIYIKDHNSKSFTVTKSSVSGSEQSICYDDMLDNQSSSVVNCLLSIGSDIIAIPAVANISGGYQTVCDVKELAKNLSDNKNSLNDVRSLVIVGLDGAKFGANSIKNTCYITGGSCLVAVASGGTFVLADAGCVASATCFVYTTATMVMLDIAMCGEEWLYNVTCNQDYDKCASDFIHWVTDLYNESTTKVSEFYNGISNYAAAVVDQLGLKSNKCAVETWVTYHDRTMYFRNDTLYNQMVPGIMKKHDGANVILSATDDQTQYHFRWIDNNMTTRIRISDNRDSIHNIYLYDVRLKQSGKTIHAIYDFNSTTPTLQIDIDDNGSIDTVIAPSTLPPTVTTVTSGSRCGAGTITLTAKSSSGVINWYDKEVGGNMIGVGDSLTTPIIESTTTYYAEAIHDGYISEKRRPLIATVNYIPSLNILPVSQSKHTGDSITYNLSPGGTPPFTYQWKKDGEIITNASGSSLVLNSLTLNDTGAYTCIVTNDCGSVTADLGTLTVHHYPTLQGTISYDNATSSPLSNCDIVLQSLEGIVLYSSKTDSSGHYIFKNIKEGIYHIVITTNKKTGGINPTDALIVNRDYIGIYTFTDKLKEKAGDVSNDGKLNPIDALMINKNYIGMITIFKSGDWLFEQDTITITSDTVKDFKALCFGDVNGSYTKIPFKKISDIQVAADPKILLKISDRRFELPFRVSADMEVGALGMKFQVPYAYGRVTGVRSDFDGLIYSINSNYVSIAWSALHANVHLTPDDVMFTLIIESEGIKEQNDMNIVIDPTSILVDGDMYDISHVMLSIPTLQKSGYYNITCYPNPFSDAITFQYSLPETSIVHLDVYNALGINVGDVFHQSQDAGTYTELYSAKGLAQGLYFYTFTANTFTYSGILILSK